MIRSVGQIIADDLAKTRVFERLTISQLVFEALKYTLGKDLLEHVKILGFKNGVVWIGTPTSVYAHELSFFERDILERVNSLVGEPLVKKIRFKTLW